ncbi:MAG TPA: SGNH/GDSL hydrolase family protein [Leifsonia sp.]|jgi:acyl-CoA thioesterase-1|nr:SGNH/GDSL hydrolase family protein [Leifsonia sp.]
MSPRPRSRGLFRRGGALATFLLVALGLAACSVAPSHASVVASPKRPTPSRVTAVVIGDSVAAGLGVQPDESWPALVASAENWQLDNLAVSGAGFVAPGDDGKTFEAQVAKAIDVNPRIVIVGATDNDVGTDGGTLDDAASTQLKALRAGLPHAIILGTNALSGAVAQADLDDGDARVQQAVIAVGGHWLDLGQPFQGQSSLVQNDGEHPTAAGHQMVAKELLAAIRRLHLPTGPPS